MTTAIAASRKGAKAQREKRRTATAISRKGRKKRKDTAAKITQIFRLPGDATMNEVKIIVTLEVGLIRMVDQWVGQGLYPNRSQAVQAALREKMERWKRARLWKELAKLDAGEECALAEERLSGETWFVS